MASRRVHTFTRLLAISSLVLAVLAPPAGAQWRVRNCSTVGKNLFVRDVMQDLYYWYQFIPDPNPVLYPSPEAYLEAVRYRPLDDSFSYITSKAASEAFYSASQFIGFGLSQQTRLTPDGLGAEMRILQIFPESPASEAGLARGDRILAVGGRTIDDWWQSGQLGDAFGPTQEGIQTTVVYQRGEAEPVQAVMTKRLVTIPTVSLTQVYERDGRKIGYIFFRNFVTPSVAALDEAFVQLREAGVSELILDLRYNGGGLVSVAQHLASLIGGQRTNGLVMAEYFHNDRNTFRNMLLRFEEKPNALVLSRLVVITTRSSASASELVINALRPFMPVVVIGEATFGKPVGQYAIDFCDRTLAPVSFTLRNANGEGDFFGGFPPQCSAPDDIDHQLGDPDEGSLAEALHFAQRGTCRSTESAADLKVRRSPVALRETGFRQLVGAW